MRSGIRLLEFSVRLGITCANAARVRGTACAALITLVLALPLTASAQFTFSAATCGKKIQLVGSPTSFCTPGVVRAWGSNSDGQLGNGTTTDSNVPVDVVGLTDVVQVSAGWFHSVALKSDGTVWAWGSNEFGQLGNGTNTASLVALQVPGLTDVVKVAAGDVFNLALKSDGTVWAWGSNNGGRFGNGNSTSSNVPVPGPALAGIADIAAGVQHALATDGFKIWAWGHNNSGQLGNGTTDDSLSPVEVKIPANLPGAVNVSGIFAVSNHSMALFGDGKVVAWGYNGDGSFGDGTTTSSTLPVVAVASNVDFLGPFDSHTLFVLDDLVYAAGRNFSGQLGNGTNTDSATRVQVSNLEKIWIGTFQPQVAAGFHSLAAVDNGTAWAWGLNLKGQLGNGTNTNSNVPVQVSGLQGVVAVEARGGFLDRVAHSLAIVAPTVSIENARIDFGTVGTGTTSAEQVVTIHNQGPGPLTITSIDQCGNCGAEFVIAAPPLPVTLESGGSASLSVKFAPETGSPASSVAAVRNNGFYIDMGFTVPQSSRGSQLIRFDGFGDPNADIVLTSATSPLTAVPGDTLAYGMTITNLGRALADSATIGGSLPGELTFVSCTAGGGGTCSGSGNNWMVTFAPLEPGASADVVIEAQVNPNVVDATVISNVAMAEGITANGCTTCDPNVNNNTVSWKTTIQNKADLFVTQSVAKDKNRQLTYTIKVNNLGPFAARRLVLSDVVPNTTRFVSLSPGGWTCSAPPAGAVGTVTCTIEALAAGETQSLTLVVKTTAPGSVDVSNTASVNALTFDPNVNNNSATLVTRVSGK